MKRYVYYLVADYCESSAWSTRWGKCCAEVSRTEPITRVSQIHEEGVNLLKEMGKKTESGPIVTFYQFLREETV